MKKNHGTHQLLDYIQPSNMEVAQRLGKIFINSCYDRIVGSSNFKLYEAEKSICSVPV